MIKLKSIRKTKTKPFIFRSPSLLLWNRVAAPILAIQLAFVETCFVYCRAGLFRWHYSITALS